MLFPWTARIYDRDLVNIHSNAKNNKSRAMAAKRSANEDSPTSATAEGNESTKTSTAATSDDGSAGSSKPTASTTTPETITSDALKAQITEVVNSLEGLVKNSDINLSAGATPSTESEKSSEADSKTSKSSACSSTDASSSTAKEPTSTSSNTNAKELRGHTHTFYQVLIDARDCPFIVSDIKSLKE